MEQLTPSPNFVGRKNVNHLYHRTRYTLCHNLPNRFCNTILYNHAHLQTIRFNQET